MTKRKTNRKPALVNPVEIPCPGEAHSNPFIDNCWTCAPRWGVIMVEATDPRAVEYFAVQAKAQMDETIRKTFLP